MAGFQELAQRKETKPYQKNYIFHTEEGIELKLDTRNNILFFTAPHTDAFSSPLLLSPLETNTLVSYIEKGTQTKMLSIIIKITHHFLQHCAVVSNKQTNNGLIYSNTKTMPSLSQKEIDILLQNDMERIKYHNDGIIPKPPKPFKVDQQNFQDTSGNFKEWYAAPLLTAWQETRLVRAYAYSANQDIRQQALEELLKHNVRLLTQIVNHFEETYGSSLSERLQDAFVVFMEQLPRFDPAKGWRLSTFLIYNKSYILRRIVEQYAAPVKLSTSAIKGNTVKVRQVLNPIYLDDQAFQENGDGLTVGETYEFDDICIEDTVFSRFIEEEIKKEIEAAHLPIRQELVVLLYCGMKQKEQSKLPSKRAPSLGFSFAEIAKLLKLTYNTVHDDFKQAAFVLQANPRLRHLFEDFFAQQVPTPVLTKDSA